MFEIDRCMLRDKRRMSENGSRMSDIHLAVRSRLCLVIRFLRSRPWHGPAVLPLVGRRPRFHPCGRRWLRRASGSMRGSMMATMMHALALGAVLVLALG